jgi:orotidine 5'-phosphate decarboxylase subfamily 2
MNPIEKYNQRVEQINSLVCVGLDSEISKIPAQFQNSQHPQFEFNKYIIDQTADFTAAYKPNMAFYEARGGQGLTELKMTLEYIQAYHPDILTICDAKRADIGSTNEGYTKAIFDWLNFDAITLHPYLGKEALQPFLDRKEKASIILCRTSNKGAAEFQDLESGGKKIWQIIAEKVSNEWNANNNCMLVAGATYPEELGEIRKIVGDMTLLVPGIGAQGGDVEKTVKAGLNSQNKGMIINSSRGIIFTAEPRVEAEKLRDQINHYR